MIWSRVWSPTPAAATRCRCSVHARTTRRRAALPHQAASALEAACNKAGVTRHQVISALLDLVTIDEEGRPTKRRDVLDELSSTTVDKLKPFVDRRLLSTEAEGERTVVGAAHESFLVNWPPLTG